MTLFKDREVPAFAGMTILEEVSRFQPSLESGPILTKYENKTSLYSKIAIPKYIRKA